MVSFGGVEIDWLYDGKQVSSGVFEAFFCIPGAAPDSAQPVPGGAGWLAI
jgi:hypothetical protein